MARFLKYQFESKEAWDTLKATIQTQYTSYLANFAYKNKYIRALVSRGLFVNLNFKKYNALVLNLMRCETHHEISKEVLNKHINKL
jgi:hypothetical protein